MRFMMQFANSSKRIGYVAVAASAIIFGFTPVIAAMSYQGGSNGINMAFFRALIPLPVLWLLSRRQGNISSAGLRKSILPGVFLFSCTLLLYSSYQYISPGLATTLHFLYPLLVSVYESLVQKRQLGRLKRLGIVVAVIGAVCMTDFQQQQIGLKGAVLAILSAFCYTAYMVTLEKDSVRSVPLYHLMTGISLTGIAMCGTCGIILGKITFHLTAVAWFCAIAAAMLTAVIGCVLFQFGVRKAGKSDAAVFSLLEPFTSVFFTILFMHESLCFRSLFGCVLIILGLLLSVLERKS